MGFGAALFLSDGESAALVHSAACNRVQCIAIEQRRSAALIYVYFDGEDEQRIPKAMTKRVYLFEEGDKSMRDLLGGKGANLAEMTNIGLPVPPGFTSAR